RRGDRARPTARPALPARRDRLGRLLLPEGRDRAQAARLELGLPLPAAERGDRGERAPEAARGREARETSRQAAWKDDRPARAPGDGRARARAPAELVEAIILAGGKAERLGDAAAGRPKALVEIAGRPLAAYQVEQLAAAGVDRVIVSCAAGQEDVFEAALGGIGPEIVAVGEREPLGRGGGIRFAAASRREPGDVFALNGDELVDVELEQLLE